MNVEYIVDKYFDRIEVLDTDYLPEDNGEDYDIAYLLLEIPKEMFYDYQKLKGEDETQLPEGNEIWKEGGLYKKLRGKSGELGDVGHEPIEDVLDFLSGEIRFQYQHQHDGSILMSVYEPYKMFSG